MTPFYHCLFQIHTDQGFIQQFLQQQHFLGLQVETALHGGRYRQGLFPQRQSLLGEREEELALVALRADAAYQPLLFQPFQQGGQRTGVQTDFFTKLKA